MLQIYYGYGRGKTSTLNGLAIRAKGAGLQVGVFRFLKGRETSEDSSLKKIGINVKRYHYSKKFVLQMNSEEKHMAREAAKEGMRYILSNKEKYDLIFLDEFLDLLDPTVNFFSEGQLLEFLNCLKNKEVLISGHKKYKRIFQAAGLITFYKMEKHYYKNGIKARKGFEF